MQNNTAFSQTQLYGLSYSGGSDQYGTIFHYTPSDETQMVDFSFSSPYPGAAPMYTKLTDVGNGKLYGMTSGGDGINAGGVIFEWDPLTNEYIKKYRWLYTNNPGNTPWGTLTLYNGKLYGTTRWGGNNGDGVIFEYDYVNNIYTKKFDFIEATGAEPKGSLVMVNGKFYGMTSMGGANNLGVIFDWDPATNVYTKRYDLSTTSGTKPDGDLVYYNGLLYGVAYSGGSNNYGTIFSFNPSTGAFTLKMNMAAATGGYSTSTMVMRNNKFYGTTRLGGANGYGVIFEWDPVTNIYTVKHHFTAATGYGPMAPLLLVNDVFYGTATYAGANSAGTIFSWNPTTNTYTALHHFDVANGMNPYSGLMEYNGTLYGTTRVGGANDAGVIYAYLPSLSIFVKKIDFNVADGRRAYGSVVVDGNVMYGMTYEGGNENKGVLFEWDPISQVYTIKQHFNANTGYNPYGKLVKYGSLFYGMTNKGGANNLGTLFEWNPATNTFTKKIDFSTSTGGNPFGALIVYSGKLYGLTSTGGANSSGTIIDYNPSTGVLTKRRDLANATGEMPRGDLTLYNNKMYGMCITGGTTNAGVIFEFDPNTNAYTKKVDLSEAEGETPMGNLALYNGKFYGLTRTGGSSDYGVIFEWNPTTNVYTRKFDFNNTNGRNPGGTMYMYNGLFYGLTYGGGDIGNGVLFTWDPATNAYSIKVHFATPNSIMPYLTQLAEYCYPPDPPVNSTSTENQTICSGGTATLSATGSGTIKWYNAATDGTLLGTGNSYLTPELTSNTTYYAEDYTCGASLVRTPVTVSVVSDPDITISGATTICSGGTASLTASTSGGTGTLTYQWQYNNGSGWINAGTSGLNFTTSPLTITTDIRCVFIATGNGCNTKISNVVTITVVPDPSVTIPSGANICTGGTATLTANATGGTGTVTYQWQYYSAPNWINTGTNNSVFVTPQLTASTNYRCQYSASGADCGTSTSNTVLVNLFPDPGISISASSTSICTGGTVQLTSTALGGYGTPSFQWYSSANGSDWTAISGATESTYNSPALSSGIYYRCTYDTDASGCDLSTSNQIYISVNADPSLTITSINDLIICAGSIAAFYVQTHNGGVAPISFQWQRSTDGNTWTDIGGATGSSYNAGYLYASSYFRCAKISGASGCETGFSNAILITVNPDPSVSISGNTEICYGGVPHYTAVAGGGVGTLHYQWQYNIGIGWNNTGTDSNQLDYSDMNIFTSIRCLVSSTGPGCDESTSNTVNTAVYNDPAISVSGGTTVCTGGSTTLTASVSGGTGTFTFQWQYNTGSGWVNTGSGLLSYTTSALTNNTDYRCIFSATAPGCDQTISNTETVFVVADPTISAFTSSNWICTGGTVQLSSTVSGGVGSGSYQWYSSPNASVWTPISGATEAIWNSTVLTTGSYYRCSYSTAGAGCNTATSNQLYITVSADPTLTIQCTGSTAICIGGSTSFFVNTHGGGAPLISFQWQQSADGDNWSDIPGAGTSSYLTGSLNTSTYFRCAKIAGGFGCETGYSSAIHILVNSDPDITISGATTICSGGTALLTASASGGTGTLAYQWQYYNGTTWVNTGTNSANYTTSVLTTNTNFRCLYSASGNGCDAKASNVVTVTVIADPSISVATSSNSICAGGTVQLSSSVSGGTGSETYQWYSSPNASVWTPISGATQAIWNSPVLTSGSYYRCTYSTAGAGCNTATSNQLYITVNSDPYLNIQCTGSTEVCTGGSTSFLVNMHGGGAPPISFQWQQSSNGTLWGDISGATSSTLGVSSMVQNMYYRCVKYAGGSGCEAGYSNVIYITVNNDPQISIISDATICTGGSKTLTATASGGAGTISFQWQYNSGSVWINAGPSSDEYIVSPTVSTIYRCLYIASGSGCQTAYSNSVSITIVPDPDISISGGTTVCTLGTATLTANVSGGTGTLSYQWQYSNGPDWINSPTNGPTYNTSTLMSTTNFRCIYSATGNGCESKTSNIETVTVVDDPSITISTSSNWICTGGSIQLNSSVAGGVGAESYQWYSSPNAGTWSAIPGANQPVWNSPVLTTGSYYRCTYLRTGSGCNIATSSQLYITVDSDPSLTIQCIGTTSVCTGGSTGFIVNSHGGGAPPISFKWQSSSDGATWSDIPGANTSSYITGLLSVGAYYRCAKLAAGSGCDTGYSNAILVTVTDDPAISITPTQTICNGGSASLTANATGGTGTVTYQWQYFSSPNWVNTGTNSPVLTANALEQSTIYRCIYSSSGAGCDASTSNSATVVVAQDPQISISGATTICSGGTVTLTSVSSGGAGALNYQWQYSNGSSWINTGTNSSQLITSPIVQTTGFRCLYSASASGCETAISNTVTITVNNNITVVLAANTTVCTDGSSLITTQVSPAGTYTYQWQYNLKGVWKNATGFTGSTLLTHPPYTREYRVAVTPQNSNCYATISSPINIQVVNDPIIKTHPQSRNICSGGYHIMNVLVTGGTALNYQWQLSADMISWHDIPGAISYEYNTGILLETYYFRCAISNNSAGCDLVISNAAYVMVHPDPLVYIPEVQSVCSGAEVNIAAVTFGGIGAVAYQWQQMDGSNWFNIENATSSNYKSTMLTTGSYRCIVDFMGWGCNQAVSNAVTVQVVPDPYVITQPLSSTVEAGESILLTVEASGGTELSYQWYYLTYYGSWLIIPGATNSSFLANPPYTRNYKVKIISSGEHCNAKFSDVACITVVNNTGKAAADNYNPSESETIQQNNDGLFKRSEISLFPNPTNEIINIKALVEQEGDYCIEVLDILGFSVYMGTFVSSDGEVSVSINLNQYPSAMYVVRITGKDTKLVARFIKN